MIDHIERGRTPPSALIGLTLHALLAFPYLLAGLFASLWTAMSLWTVWTAILMLALTQRRRHPVIVAFLPAIALGIWLMAFSTGAA